MSEIHGYCDPRFESVKDAFAANFDLGLELGASVAITLGEDTIVDLWGGYADGRRTRPWDENSIVMVASTTKIMTALCGLMLIDRGLLDPDASVASYWPEFAAKGKSGVLIRHIFTHQSGLPGPWPPVPFTMQQDWDTMTQYYADAELWWQPGEEFGYHSESFGFLIGEVLRRITGKTIGQFLQEEVCSKIGADFFIGLPKSEFPRVTALRPLDLAPSVDNLPEQCIAPEKINGNWQGEIHMLAMDMDVQATLETRVDNGRLAGDLTLRLPNGEFTPEVEDVRFDGDLFRMRLRTPGGMVTWDGAMTADDQLDVTMHSAGQQVSFVMRRGIPDVKDLDLKVVAEDTIAGRMGKSLIPPAWVGMESLAAELPSANGMGNARSVARIGAIMANGGQLAGHQFLSPETFELLLTEQCYQQDLFMSSPVRFGFGMGLNSTEFPCPSDRAVHWGGAGGSVCVMDNSSRSAFAYVMNGMLPGRLNDPRSEAIRTAYEACLSAL